MNIISGYWGHEDTRLAENEMVIHSCGNQKIDVPIKTYRPNGRHDYQLIYINKGQGFFHLDELTVLEEGTIIIYAPCEAQIYHYDTTHFNDIYYIHFSGDAAEALLQDAGLSSKTPYHLGASGTLCFYFKKIIEELQIKPSLYRQVSIALFTELIGYISRKIQADTHPIPPTIHNSILRTITLMHKDHSSSFSVEEYARMCSLSKFYFCHCFKNITGYSPIAYRNGIRIEKAKELLEENQLSVSEVSAATGFESASYFSKTFKKYEGVSPLDYKLRHNKENNN